MEVLPGSEIKNRFPLAKSPEYSIGKSAAREMASPFNSFLAGPVLLH
jgi:hypothetical protein